MHCGTHFTDGRRSFIKLMDKFPSGVAIEACATIVQGKQATTFNSIDYDGIFASCPVWLEFEVLPKPSQEEKAPHYMIRLKRFPDRYIGKKNTSYALTNDRQIKSRWNGKADEAVKPDAHWFKSERYAHVWTDRASLKRLITYCGGLEAGFSEYEFLRNGQPFNPVELYTKK